MGAPTANSGSLTNPQVAATMYRRPALIALPGADGHVPSLCKTYFSP